MHYTINNAFVFNLYMQNIMESFEKLSCFYEFKNQIWVPQMEVLLTTVYLSTYT